ncbi:hypothetical protein [Aromatoleum evansii]|uniref:hypothetical protein n=1 Tax=Aromatoleum evansii TaxID=59406 RepID=UPI00145DEA4C|nr:hypothetical protein [Aromatoleum evansii]NMG32359.1 hypothetical protein [Aromatoleum evansii]
MTSNLENRLERLELALQSVRTKPVILFLLPDNSPDYAEQQAAIARLKAEGRTLILMTDDKGAWAFEGTRQVFPMEADHAT